MLCIAAAPQNGLLSLLVRQSQYPLDSQSHRKGECRRRWQSLMPMPSSSVLFNRGTLGITMVDVCVLKDLGGTESVHG
jgi:hypothetical protein